MQMIWAVVRNLFIAFFILVVFGRAETPYETSVLAMLLLILVSVEAYGIINNLSHAKLAIGLDQSFTQVRRLLKERTPDLEEQTKEFEDKLNRQQAIVNINTFFIAIFYLIGLWYLLFA